eukprot:GFYU01011115.1.p2 GENE.GFYU01011115.1~~GFYU01011115.1.p2  ORF type:complete len:379 (+),score=154.06 GFYU01011115.1:106-1242(+)
MTKKQKKTPLAQAQTATTDVPTEADKSSAAAPAAADVQKMLSSKIAELQVDNKENEEENRIIERDFKKKVKEASTIAGGNQTADEKVNLLQQKLVERLNEHKATEREASSLRRQNASLSKEKENVHSELKKSNTLRTKFENLCRELQKQNNSLLEQTKQIQENDHANRKELTVNFNNKLVEIQERLEKQSEEQIEYMKENETLKKKLRVAEEEYEAREHQFAHSSKLRQVECQLADARGKQAEQLAQQEMLKADAYKNQCATLLETEQELRNQITAYSGKFETFQDAITKSSDAFGTFRAELDKSSKRNIALQKEVNDLKRKTALSDVKLIELVEQNTQLQKEVETQTKKREKLQTLCSTLQKDRQELVSLKEKYGEA